MRFTELFERAFVDTAHSRYEAHGRTFYISHRLDDMMVQCGCYVAAVDPRRPLREKVGVANCQMVDTGIDTTRNNIRVFSAKSVVQDGWRRFGILSAMYDHLEKFGFTVYPADGSVGDQYMQSQSDDAKAFWARRNGSRQPVKLVTVSDAERYGWGEWNIFAHADKIGSMPVLYEQKLHGYSNPLLVLWEKAYAKGMQRVGVIYTVDHGYKVAAHIEHPRVGSIDGTIFVRDGRIHWPHAMWGKFAAAGTARMIVTVANMIDSL